MSWFRRNGPAGTPPAAAAMRKFWLGRYARPDGRPGAALPLPSGVHYALIGSTGSGKTSAVGIPRLLSTVSRAESLLSIDFKGTQPPITARHRRSLGDVKIIDPYGLTGFESAGFNPIGHMRADSDLLVDDALGLAIALCPEEGHEPHWPQGAQQVVAGLTIGEVSDADREGRVPSFLNVHRMLCEGEAYEDLPSGWKRLIAGMRFHIARLITTGPPEVALLLGRFLRQNDEILGIQSHAITKLAFATTRAMARSLGSNDTDFAELRRRPLSIFVVCPVERVDQSRGWLRMIVTSALQQLYRPGVPVTLLLDELPLLQKLDCVTSAFALSREAGVQIMAMMQSVGQLNDAFGREAADVILGNCGVVQAFAAGDPTTARWMSERSGDTTAVSAGYQKGESFNPGGAGHSDGLSFQQIRRPLLSPFDAMSLPKGTGVIWVSGSPKTIPFIATPYFSDPELNARADPNPFRQPRGHAAE